MPVDISARGLSAAETARNRRLSVLNTLRRSMVGTQLSPPKLAAVLPEIGSPATSSSIAGSVLLSAVAAPEKFQLTGGVWDVSGSVFPKNQTIAPITIHPGNSGDPATDARQGQGQRIRFNSWAPELELRVAYGDTSGGFRLKVDGSYVHSGLLGNSADGTPVGALRYIPISWGDGSASNRQQRTYELEWASNGAFAGVASAPLYDVQPAGPADALRLLIHGDSMVSTIVDTASAADSLLPAQGALIPALLGQPDCWVSGVGGTGWVNDNGGSKALFNERQALDVLAPSPDVIIEIGGRNDGGLANKAQLQSLVEEWLDNVLAAKPETIIFMSGPILSRGGAENAATDNMTVRDAKRDAAAKYPSNVAFLDNLSEEWSTGTGNQASPAGNGNADWTTGADSAHFTLEGHQLSAGQIARAISVAIPALTAAQ